VDQAEWVDVSDLKIILLKEDGKYFKVLQSLEVETPGSGDKLNFYGSKDEAVRLIYCGDFKTSSGSVDCAFSETFRRVAAAEGTFNFFFYSYAVFTSEKSTLKVTKSEDSSLKHLGIFALQVKRPLNEEVILRTSEVNGVTLLDETSYLRIKSILLIGSHLQFIVTATTEVSNKVYFRLTIQKFSTVLIFRVFLQILQLKMPNYIYILLKRLMLYPFKLREPK
jgi:hypothetical protein